MLVNRKQTLVILFVLLGISSSRAQDSIHQATADPIWDSIKVEMTRCFVCRNIVAHWYKLVSKMSQRVIRRDNGIAFIQYPTFSDSSELKIFQMECLARDSAFKKCLSMHDKEAKDSLCSFCLELRKLAKSGALVNRGQTESGNWITIDSNDSTLQAKIFDFLATFALRFGIDLKGFIDPKFTISREDTVPDVSDWPIDAGPVLIYRVAPEYPEAAYANKSEGQVLVAILVGTDGKVMEVRILKSSNESFNKVTFAAAWRWVFKPAIQNKKPVMFWYHAPAIFKIRKDSS